MKTNSPTEPAKQDVKHSALGDAVAAIMLILIPIALLGGSIWGLIAYMNKQEAAPEEAVAAQAEPEPQTPASVPTVEPAVPPLIAPPAPTGPMTVQPAPAVPPPAAPVATDQTTFTALHAGRDAEIVSRKMRLSVTGYDAGHLRLDISNAVANTLLTIPAGLMAEPMTDGKGIHFVVARTTNIAVSASGKPVTAYLLAAAEDFRGYPPANANAAFLFNPDLSNDVLTRFLETASARTSSWNVVQGGVWIIMRNISSPEMAKFELPAPDPLKPGQTRKVKFVDYRDIKTVESMLAGLGVDTEGYRIFADERTALVQLLRDLEPDSPRVDTVLQSKAATRYVGNPDVMQTLALNMQNNPRFKSRIAAMECLMEMGVGATPDQVRNQALWPRDTYTGFAAARELFLSGDYAGLALVSCYADDPTFAPYCADAVTEAIKSKSGVERAQNESIALYWKRALGLSSITQSRGAVSQVSNAIANLTADYGAKLVPLLEKTASDMNHQVSQACNELARFPGNRQAFDTVARLAMKHASVDVRRSAIQSLSRFPNFSPLEVCGFIMKNGPPELAVQCVRLACENVFDGVDATLEPALRSPDNMLRREVAYWAGRARLLELTPILVKLARYDGEGNVREAAAESLCQMRAKEGREIIEALLAAGEKTGKHKAVRYLNEWGSDPAIMPVLEKYKNDPDVGKTIQATLKRFGG